MYTVVNRWNLWGLMPLRYHGCGEEAGDAVEAGFLYKLCLRRLLPHHLSFCAQTKR